MHKNFWNYPIQVICFQLDRHITFILIPSSYITQGISFEALVWSSFLWSCVELQIYLLISDLLLTERSPKDKNQSKELQPEIFFLITFRHLGVLYEKITQQYSIVTHFFSSQFWKLKGSISLARERWVVHLFLIITTFLITGHTIQWVSPIIVSA